MGGNFDWDEDERSGGCCFPGKCLMPGEHLPSECLTVQMMEDHLADVAADQMDAICERGLY